MPRLRKGITNGGIDYTMYGIPDMIALMIFIAPVETWHATSQKRNNERGIDYPMYGIPKIGIVLSGGMILSETWHATSL